MYESIYDSLEADPAYELFEEQESECACPHCGQPRLEMELSPAPATLVDLVTSAARSPGVYGTASSFRNPEYAKDRCIGPERLRCPDLKGLRESYEITSVPFEYIGGSDKKPGIILDRASKRWKVVEANRQRRRAQRYLPRAGDALATFVSNMRSAGLPLAAILTMGSIYCRCISNTNRLSNHAHGDAIDIGGIRLTSGVEVLVANYKHAPDRKVLHRANGCLRLAFANVLDYHDKRHWDHFHCDTNLGRGRTLSLAWPFVRESLGLPAAGGWSKQVAERLRQLTQNQNAAKDRPALDQTLSQLFRRQATAA
jgi:hypothetical protein